jgi:hypothetical protein
MPPRRVHWIDANVLITAKDGPFRFSINPGFWAMIDEQSNAGVIRVPKMVYDEIVNNGHPEDDLTKWVKVRRTSGLFVPATPSVQKKFTTVADHINANYEQHHAVAFLAVADPWLIAHASESNGVVVTFESRQLGAKKVKIPNACAELNIPFINPYDMLEQLKITFERRNPR